MEKPKTKTNSLTLAIGELTSTKRPNSLDGLTSAIGDDVELGHQTVDRKERNKYVENTRSNLGDLGNLLSAMEDQLQEPEDSSSELSEFDKTSLPERDLYKMELLDKILIEYRKDLKQYEVDADYKLPEIREILDHHYREQLRLKDVGFRLNETLKKLKCHNDVLRESGGIQKCKLVMDYETKIVQLQKSYAKLTEKIIRLEVNAVE